MNNDISKRMEDGYLFCEENLIELCQEMLEYGETGILCNGKVRELAKMFSFAGSSARQMAEESVKISAMRRLVYIGSLHPIIRGERKS